VNGASANADRDRGGRRLGAAISIDEAEVPVVDGMAAAPPLVGPGERDRAARAFLERGPDVHRRDCGLAVFAFADAVGARFREQQRLVPRDVLEARQIRSQLGLPMQVHVEGADVEERQIQELRRREVHVGEQARRRRAFRVVVQIAQEAFDADTAVPSNDARRDFVAEGEREDGRMIAKLSDLGDELAANLALQVPVVEKRDVLGPRQPDHDSKPFFDASSRRSRRGGVYVRTVLMPSSAICRKSAATRAIGGN
jgi:hypothetical protein